MKILVILTLLLCVSTTRGQETPLERVLQSIIHRGFERDVDVRALMDIHVDTIIITPAHEMPPPKSDLITEVLGSAHYIKTRKGKHIWKVIISDAVIHDLQLFERILAHELGHTFGLKHCCTQGDCLDIMSTGHVTDPENLFYRIQFHPFESIRFWDKYFSDIKSKNK